MQLNMKIKTNKRTNKWRNAHSHYNSVLRLPLRVFSKEMSEIPVTVPSDINGNNLVMIYMYKHFWSLLKLQ